ncbi:MAG TPA: PadR family transcriptional regulator [Streptosporangiaceae bacterium]|nr:PadR family transcriptional regulator [Streptosporangiaceae bacterium]
MRAGKCAGWNFDAGLWDVLNLANDAIDQAIRTATAAATGGPGWRGGHWGGGRSGHWGGSHAGAWAGFWPGPPGAQRGSKAGRGDVRAAILALLSEGPRTGYQIMSDIKERSDGAWRPSPGAVYPALAQLADEGLIEGEESGGRRTYTLTQAGHDYLEEHPEMARPAWESMAQQDEHNPWEVPGLLAEAAKLGGGIMQVAQLGSAEQVLAAERLLERTRRELFQILADDFTPDEGVTEPAD